MTHYSTQPDLWAQRPGRSFVNEFPPGGSIHLTLKLNMSERLVHAALFGTGAEHDEALAQYHDIVMEAAKRCLEATRASLAPDVAVKDWTAPQPLPTASQALVSAVAHTGEPPINYDECLSCQ